MKKMLRLVLVLGLSALAASLTTRVSAAEEKSAPKASIRPTGEVKPADLPGLAKITFQQAIAAALKASPGDIIQAELEVENGNLMYSFRIVGAGRKIKEVEIDAGNGKVLDTENEEDEKEGVAKKKD